MKRTRIHFIYWALLISFVAHFTLAPIVRNMKFVDAAAEQPPQTIVIDATPKPPTPKKTPPPVKPQRANKPAPKRAHQAVAPVLPRNNNSNTRSSEVSTAGEPIAPNPGSPDAVATGDGNATPAPTIAPAPTATPKPACATPFADAKTLEKYVPETPRLALEQGLTGETQVQVELSAAGRVIDAKVFASSGSSALDAAAIDAAKRTTYTPKVVDCERVPGTYLFRVDFQTN